MLPNQLIESLKGVSGFDEQAFLDVHQSAEILTSIRQNPLKTNKGLLNIKEPVSWCNNGFYLTERPSFVFDPLWHAGAYYVQEASSMFLWHICTYLFTNNSNKLVLDLCAAPGGKTTLLASFFTDGLIIANEVIKTRAAILQENITKWGTNNVVITNNDVEHFKVLPNFCDAIFVDAPCSGSGLFRKDKNAVKEWSENGVELCSQRQKRILGSIIPTLKQDGYLIYSTCSYSTQENEDIVDWVLDNFEVENITLPLTNDWKIVASPSAKHKAIGYRFYPYLVKGEGFFVAVFKNLTVHKEQFKKTSKVKKLQSANKHEGLLATLYLQNALEHSFLKHNESVIAVSKVWENELEIIAQHLYIKKVGTIIGQIMQNDLIPAHDIGLSTIKSDIFTTISVEKDVAIKYLQRKEIVLETNVKGWALIEYCEVCLGWIKVLPNRINNYYPKEWRILKDYF